VTLSKNENAGEFEVQRARQRAAVLGFAEAFQAEGLGAAEELPNATACWA
jgi:hypothetical protein